jgi:hypothetical protein
MSCITGVQSASQASCVLYGTVLYVQDDTKVDIPITITTSALRPQPPLHPENRAASKAKPHPGCCVRPGAASQSSSIRQPELDAERAGDVIRLLHPISGSPVPVFGVARV